MKDKLNNKPPVFPEPSPAISSFNINLIKKCMSFEANKRTAFDEIVALLSSDSRFIADYVDEQYFKNYSQSLDPTTFQAHTESIFKGELNINNFEK